MKTWEEYAAHGPHLRRVAALSAPGLRCAAAVGEYVYLATYADDVSQVLVVDARDPAAPAVVRALPFKNRVSALVVAGDRLLVAEPRRALHVYDVTTPAEPGRVDCGVALGRDLYDVATLGTAAVVAQNWDGVGVMDLTDPHRARWIAAHKLEDGFVESVCVAEGLIFAAGAADGLVVLSLVDGALAVVARPAGKGFNASEVFRMGPHVWVVGSNAKDKPELVVIDPRTPDRVLHRLTTKLSMPKCLLPTAGGGGVGFYTHYSCALYEPERGSAGLLFKQYTADEGGAYWERREPDARRDVPQLTCMETISQLWRRGPHLFAVQGPELSVFEILPGSVFEAVPG